MINPFSTLRTWLRSIFTSSTATRAIGDGEPRPAVPIAADSDDAGMPTVTVDEVRAHIAALCDMLTTMLKRRAEFHFLSTMMLEGMFASLGPLDRVTDSKIKAFLLREALEDEGLPRLKSSPSIADLMYALAPDSQWHLDIMHATYKAATNGTATDIGEITLQERIIVQTLYHPIGAPFNEWDQGQLDAILNGADGELRAAPNLPDDPPRVLREEEALTVLRAAGFTSGSWRVICTEEEADRYLAAYCVPAQEGTRFIVQCIVEFRTPPSSANATAN